MWLYNHLIVRDEYITYVRLEKNYSFNTVLEYEKDVDAFLDISEVEGITDLNDVAYSEARLYVTGLYDNGLSRASISRKISSVRSFFKFANARYDINDIAFRSLHHPKKEERLPAFFYEEEMELLFSSCKGQDKKSLRDYALLELLYATGICHPLSPAQSPHHARARSVQTSLPTLSGECCCR